MNSVIVRVVVKESRLLDDLTICIDRDKK
jgi:hypothetical protein